MAMIAVMEREIPRGEAAPHVMEIAEQLQLRVGDVATIDVHHEPGYLADLSVTPHVARALAISIVGIGSGFVVSLGDRGFRRAELDDTVSGRADLASLVEGAIVGRGWGKRKKWPAYR